MNTLLKPIKSCLSCNKSYPKNNKYSKSQWVNSKYCSYKCHSKKKSLIAKTKPVSKKSCKQCNKIFLKKYGSDFQWSTLKFCSPRCAGEAKKIKDGLLKDERSRRKRGINKRGSKEDIENISRLTKLAMQRPEVQEKIRQSRKSLSLEHRMKLSDVHKGKMPANLYYDNSNYSNIKRGYYDINGTTMYFRSKWEANYALYLDFLVDHKEIYKWEFEPDTFMFEAIKLGTRSYTPDFKVFITETDFEYHEVKGYMDSKSKTKLKRFAKYYPKHKLILIDSSTYNILKKQIGKLCKFYD